MSSQPVLPVAPWVIHPRLVDAAAESVNASCLLSSFDCLSLPYTHNVWCRLPTLDGSPRVIKRCAPSVRAQRGGVSAFRVTPVLLRQQRVFYEVLRAPILCGRGPAVGRGRR